MASTFRPTTIADEQPLSEFLIRVFAADSNSNFVSPAMLRWKYWGPREDYSEPRSYVIEQGGCIVAHVGLWPITVRVGAVNERGVHMIDWASDPNAPGAGVSLLQRLTKLFDFIYSIGGSESTQSILPKFGFRTVAETLTWGRPIRPWRQMFQRQNIDLRTPLRFARNLWWSKTPPRVIADGWAAIELRTVGADTLTNLESERDALFFQYLRRCPAARCLTFRIEKEGQVAGFLALAVVQRQARVAGVWLEDPSSENWREAFLVSQEVALRHTDASELIARSSTKASAAAAGQSGMRVRARTPVFLFRKVASAEPLPLLFQLSDNDEVFLRGQETDFLT